MTSLPLPATVPYPSTSNPNKANARRWSNIFHYWRWRISSDINFRSHRRYRRCRIDNTSNCEE
jgi:hypothetical protein